MRNTILIFTSIVLLCSCNRKFLVEKMTNDTHVKTIRAEVFQKTISKSDLENAKEFVLSDEEGSGVVIRMSKDSSGNLKIKTYVPSKTVVFKNQKIEAEVKEIPKKRNLFKIVISVFTFLGLFLLVKKYKF